MPHILCQVVSNNPTNVPRDRTINDWHFNWTAPGEQTLAQLSVLLDGFYNSIKGYLAYVPYREYRYYVVPGPQGIGPVVRVEQATPGTLPGAGATHGPDEIALCLSYFSGQNTARKRGRIYLGPIVASSQGAARPNLPMRTAIVDAAGVFAAGVRGTGNGFWAQYSPTADVLSEVNNVWSDDAWDVQRRRGLGPSSRIQRPV